MLPANSRDNSNQMVGNVTPKPRGAGHFSCRHCHKVFKYEINLREHVYGNHPPTHYCFLCDDRLPIEIKPLQFHMTTVHKLPGTITCDCCDATFARKSIFDNHCKEVWNKSRIKHATPIAKSIRYRDPILSALSSVSSKQKVKAEQPAEKKKPANELPFRVVYSDDKIIPRSALPILAEAAVDIINAVGSEKLGIRVKNQNLDRGPTIGERENGILIEL